MRRIFPSTIHCGFTLIEVLIGMTVLTTGVLVIMAVFPYTLQGQRKAELLNIGAGLAQMKVEEIRRDDSVDGALLEQIRQLDQPTDPIRFLDEPRLTYAFSGESLLYEDPADPRSQSDVPRVIIQYDENFNPDQDVIYELRFE